MRYHVTKRKKRYAILTIWHISKQHNEVTTRSIIVFLKLCISNFIIMKKKNQDIFSSLCLLQRKGHFFMSIKSNYIKFPREFTIEPLASELSLCAKVMYVILSDRLEWSEKNREFQDDDGTPFVYFTVEDLIIALGCSKRTVINTLKELENIGLIYRYRQYACKANKIYVRDVKKVMLKVSESVKECSANSAPQSCKICTTEVQNLHHSHAKSAPQWCKNCTQSISKLPNQKNKSKEQVKCIKTPTQQNEYDSDYNDNSDFDYEDYELRQELQKQHNEQEEQRKQQKAEETKKLLTNHFAEVFDKINADESELLLKVLYDIYTSNRPTYTIKGKDIPRDDVSRKIFMSHWTKVLRAVQSIAEVREKKYIENEFMYLLTILYSC